MATRWLAPDSWRIVLHAVGQADARERLCARVPERAIRRARRQHHVLERENPAALNDWNTKPTGCGARAGARILVERIDAAP